MAVEVVINQYAVTQDGVTLALVTRVPLEPGDEWEVAAPGLSGFTKRVASLPAAKALAQDIVGNFTTGRAKQKEADAALQAAVSALDPDPPPGSP